MGGPPSDCLLCSQACLTPTHTRTSRMNRIKYQLPRSLAVNSRGKQPTFSHINHLVASGRQPMAVPNASRHVAEWDSRISVACHNDDSGQSAKSFEDSNRSREGTSCGSDDKPEIAFRGGQQKKTKMRRIYKMAVAVACGFALAATSAQGQTQMMLRNRKQTA